MTWNHQSRTGHRGAHGVKPRCYSSNPTESTNCRRRDRNVKQAWDRQPAASLASHVAALALRELVSFRTAEHIRNEIRRIDGSVHPSILITPVVNTLHNYRESRGVNYVNSFWRSGTKLLLTTFTSFWYTISKKRKTSRFLKSEKCVKYVLSNTVGNVFRSFFCVK